MKEEFLDDKSYKDSDNKEESEINKYIEWKKYSDSKMTAFYKMSDIVKESARRYDVKHLCENEEDVLYPKEHLR